MKNNFVLNFIIALILTTQTVFGQTATGERNFAVSNPNFKVVLAETTAVSDGEGALIAWRTSYELRNLGFNVYRLENNEKKRVNADLIAGSTFIVGENAALNAGYSYSFFDSNGAVDSQYLIEIVDVDGASRFSEIFQTAFDADARARAEKNGKAFAQLNQEREKDVFNQREYPAPLPKTERAIDDSGNENAASSAPAAAETQRWVAAQPGAKISVKKDGLYRVTKAELAAANFNLSAPTVNWQLYADGIEQPILIRGEQQPGGGLSDNGYIEFYGRGIDAAASDTRVYYLVVGSTVGRRMILNSRVLFATKVAAPNFARIVERKDRFNYTSAILNGDAENFYGAVVNSIGASVALDLKAVDPAASAPVSIKVSVQGLTTTSHRIRVALNNSELGILQGGGRVLMQGVYSVPASLLNEGANDLKLTALDGSGDVSLFESARVTYSRRFRADNNSLTFTSPNARAVLLTNFTNGDIRVFDITDPNAATLVKIQIQNDNAAFVPANRPRRLFAVAEGAQLRAASVAANAPSNWLDAARGKDLLILAHKDFLAAAETLAVYRRAQNLTVEVVGVEDVFDETGFGSASPEAIKTFLQAARPKYALLFGDATYDPRNHLNQNNKNFVLTKMVDTLFSESYTDEWFADFDGDGVGEFPVGRLPSADAATAQAMVNKIAVFEQTASAALPQRGGLFVCDNPDGYDFCGSIQNLRAQLPANMPAQFIRRSDADSRTVNQQIVSGINNGRYLVAFSGHGSIGIWTSGSILSVCNVNPAGAGCAAQSPQISTGDNLSLFLPLNCLNGAFADAYGEGLAEAMVKTPNGGSVAAWSSSGLTFPDTQEQMGIRFFRSLGNAEFARLGDAVRAAKFATTDRDVRQTWILLGDPTLKIK